MHALTSSIFFPAFMKVVPNPTNQVRLMKHWAVLMGTILVIRGRPQVDAGIVMRTLTETPLPPGFVNAVPGPHTSAVGGNTNAAGFPTNPWTHIIDSALRAPDSHTIKSIRSLLYAAKIYGQTPLGALGQDYPGIKGLKEVDGTLFIRTAGVVMDTLGWVDWGQAEGKWDSSALGWEDAWKDGK